MLEKYIIIETTSYFVNMKENVWYKIFFTLYIEFNNNICFRNIFGIKNNKIRYLAYIIFQKY